MNGRRETSKRKIEKRGVEREILSLRSTEIGISIFVGVRSKVDPHNEGYAWVSKFGSFVKL